MNFKVQFMYQNSTSECSLCGTLSRPLSPLSSMMTRHSATVPFIFSTSWQAAPMVPIMKYAVLSTLSALLLYALLRGSILLL